MADGSKGGSRAAQYVSGVVTICPTQLAISVQRLAVAVCIITGTNDLQTTDMLTGRQHTTSPQPQHRTLLF